MVLCLMIGDERICFNKQTGVNNARYNFLKTKEQAKEGRFVEKESQFINGMCYRIVVDAATGVNYLSTTVGGLTPLIDRNGSIVVNK